MSSKRTLLVLALMLAPLLAQSNYVTWDGLAKFMAVYNGIGTFVSLTIGLLPEYGGAALFVALIGAIISAIFVYILAKVAADIVS